MLGSALLIMYENFGSHKSKHKLKKAHEYEHENEQNETKKSHVLEHKTLT